MLRVAVFFWSCSFLSSSDIRLLVGFISVDNLLMVIDAPAQALAARLDTRYLHSRYYCLPRGPPESPRYSLLTATNVHGTG